MIIILILKSKFGGCESGNRKLKKLMNFKTDLPLHVSSYVAFLHLSPEVTGGIFRQPQETITHNPT